MQDRKDNPDPLALLGHQALQVQTASLALADQMVLLALVAQTAWLDLLVLPALQVSAERQVQRDRQARTARLVRRGIPEPLARQALRVL